MKLWRKKFHNCSLAFQWPKDTFENNSKIAILTCYDNNNNNNNNNNILPYLARPRMTLNSKADKPGPHFQIELEFGVLVLVEWGKPENPEKNPRSRDENQQQTQPTCDVGNRTRATALGGECSHQCIIPESPKVVWLVDYKFSDKTLNSLTFLLYWKRNSAYVLDLWQPWRDIASNPLNNKRSVIKNRKKILFHSNWQQVLPVNVDLSILYSLYHVWVVTR